MTLQGIDFSSGLVGQAFSFGGVNSYGVVPATPALDVGAGEGLTFECWIKPADLLDGHCLVEWNDGAGSVGMHLWISLQDLGGLGSIFANIVGPNGDHYVASSPGLLNTTDFQHVALTYDKSTGVARIYYNGGVVAGVTVGSFSPQTSYNMYLGARVSGPAGVGGYFYGLMDEPSLYSRALSGSEITAIYDAGFLGKCADVPPVIFIQPLNQLVRQGSNAVFKVVAGGSGLTYQWQFNLVDLPGATNATLTLTNVQSSQAGNYSILVSNVFGVTPSSNAVLTVDTSCISAAPGLVAWWPADGDGNDRLSARAGVLQGGLAFAPGEVGQAFSFDGVNDSVSNAASAQLDVGASDGLTMECWIKPQDVANAHVVMEWNSGLGGVGAHLWISLPSAGGAGSIYANLRDTSGGTHAINSNPGLLTANAFQHLALSYNRTNGSAKLFLNGVVVKAANLGIFRPQTTYPFFLGTRASGGPDSPYAGLIDEVALYNHALADSQILDIYNAGNAGKACTAPEVVTQPQNRRARVGTNVTFNVSARGQVPLSYQWRFNGNDLPGRTDASLSLTNVQSTNAGNYSVRVINPVSTTISSNATLKVDVVSAFGNNQPLTNSPVSFGGSVNVVLQNAYPGGLIFYSLDGSAPSFSSTQYTGPFQVTQNVVLRAIGYSVDFFQSGELDPVTILIVPTYTLTATNTPGGSVSLSPAGGSYLSNMVVTATATAGVGWVFLQWLGDEVATNTSLNVTMSRSKFVQAIFGTTLSTTVAGQGSVSLNPPGGLYPYGTVVWLSAIPQPGNYFGVWGNAGSGNVNPLSFGMTNPNPTVSSLFSSVGAGQAALTVVPVGKGRVAVTPRANVYTSGQMATITATPDPGQALLGWSGDATGAQNPLTVMLDQSKTIYANFTRRPALIAQGRVEGIRPEGFVLTVVGDMGARYQVERSSNLGSWAALGTVTNWYGTNQFRDPTISSPRFYRALLLP
jgi:hypothetical protein